MPSMPHLSELHGAATHLAVVAIPVYAFVLALRRFGPDHQTLRHIEPWLLVAALVGIVAAGATGLLVWGQAQTMLRGQAFRTGTAHFWLGIALALVLAVGAVIRQRTVRRGAPTHGPVLLVVGVLALGLVFAQGYLGGRMTYDQGVGVQSGGQFAQTARGVAALQLALAKGTAPAVAGKAAFTPQGLGCASCHGALAQGRRGPSVAGGIELGRFREVHGHGLFPRAVVADADVAAVAAFLRTLPRSKRDEG